ncbi:MAG: 1-acyl-sn-glycerol-3-phosphate acyltransferase, partial [Myxococcales bacterium]|nr:1-acyl-sn-glycerol-3-phosphate acyltransferase [Myxococcales bacterium]
DDRTRLRDVLAAEMSAALFLKRPPSALDIAAGATGGRGLREGDGLLQTVIAMQRTRQRPIQLVPQVFVWTKRPDTQGTRVPDLVFGPREWPSGLRTLGQFLANYRNVELKAGAPLDLKAFLQSQAGTQDEVLVRRIIYTMLRRLERERRAVTGPAHSPPDRVRQKVLRSPKLQKVISRMAGENPDSRVALTRQALKTLRQMQATPDPATTRAVGMLLDRLFNRVYAGVDVDTAGLDEVRELSKEGTLVLLPSHKSHVDYLLVSYLLDKYGLGLPLIAAGDNLSFFPAGPVARRGGAFFIRRSFSGDKLYAATAEAYIRRLLRDGHTLEVFLEGGRSRTGKLLKPQLGLLNTIVDAALALQRRPVHFIPISIGYERIIEARAFERELSGADKEPEDASSLLRSTTLLRHKYGRINVQFGTSINIRQLRQELGASGSGAVAPAKRRALVNRIANRTMDEINRVTAVTPGALTALALLSDRRRSVARPQLLTRCERLFSVLQQVGARATPGCLDGNRLNRAAVLEATQMFVDGKLLEIHRPADQALEPGQNALSDPDCVYRVPEDRRLQLDATKNHIVHFFVERGFAAVTILMDPAGVPVNVARDRILQLVGLFKHEFRYRAGRAPEDIFDEMLQVMVDSGDLALTEGFIRPGAGREGWDGETWLRTYRATVRNFLEGYRATARGLLHLLRGPLTEKDLVKRTLTTARRMYLRGDLVVSESVNGSIVENAIAAFREEGYVAIKKGRWTLTESFSSESAVNAIEGRIAAYLR